MRANAMLWMVINGWLALASTHFDDPTLFCLFMGIVNGTLILVSPARRPK